MAHSLLSTQVETTQQVRLLRSRRHGVMKWCLVHWLLHLIKLACYNFWLCLFFAGSRRGEDSFSRSRTVFRLPDPPGDDSAEVAQRKTLVVRAILSGFPENGVQTRKGGMSTLSEHSRDAGNVCCYCAARQPACNIAVHSRCVEWKCVGIASVIASASS